MKDKKSKLFILGDIYIRIIDINIKSDDEISIRSYKEVKNLATEVYGLPCRKWRIIKDNYCKPYFENKSYYLSISHTDDLIAIAVCKNKNIGIDVESIHMIDNRIIERYYSPNEKMIISNSVGFEEIESTRIWTLKEAYSKYLGTGLTKSVLSWDSYCNKDLFLKTLLFKNHLISICADNNYIY